jgi:hypothetical protein
MIIALLENPEPHTGNNELRDGQAQAFEEICNWGTIGSFELVLHISRTKIYLLKVSSHSLD